MMDAPITRLHSYEVTIKPDGATDENDLRTGTSEIKAQDGTFSAKLYLDRDESVEIDVGAEFAPELCNPPKPPPPLTPSKKLIKEAIERGEPIKGARIVKHDRLTIK